MRSSTRSLVPVSSTILGFVAFVAFGDQNLVNAAEQALKARTAAMQEHATAADVDRFLGFLDDGVVYEDPVVKMKIEGKDTIRKGMTAFLGATRNARVVVTRRIAVDGLVVLQQDVSFEEKNEEKGTWTPRERDQVTVFEFEAGKIRRIADYWAR